MRVKSKGNLEASRVDLPEPTPEAAPAPAASSSLQRRLSSDGFEAARPIKKPATPLRPAVGPSAEPALSKLDDGTLPTYQPVTGSLYANGVKADDVDQGDLGDCYFLSSLASLAQRRPQALENAIHANADGSYTVQLYQAQPNGTFKPTSVTVDSLLPEQNGQAVYATANPQELWPAIMEKAFAKLDKGYNVIDRGGLETDAMSALTGKPANSTDVTPQSANAVYAKLQRAVQQGKLTTAGTYDNADLKKALTQYQRQGVATFDPKTFTYDGFGLVDGHAYTVLGVHEENGQKYVDLRNPWGQTEPTSLGDGNDDGHFKLPLTQFAQLFQEVSIGG
jgi:hypothetical protein